MDPNMNDPTIVLKQIRQILWVWVQIEVGGKMIQNRRILFNL